LFIFDIVLIVLASARPPVTRQMMDALAAEFKRFQIVPCAMTVCPYYSLRLTTPARPFRVLARKIQI